MHSDKTGRYKAVYSDGETARSHDLVVIPGPNCLELHEGNNMIEVWAYDQITSVDHLHPGEPSQVGIADKPGARLYVDDPDFAADLLNHLPHLSRRAANRRVLVPILVVALVLSALIGGIWASGYSISQALAGLIPDNVRKGLGNQVVSSLTSGKGFCDNSDGRRALAKVVTRLETGIQNNGNFDIQVAPIGIINAFAAPGERIVLSKKLIGFVRSPEELAGIIAHEMGHGIKLHPESGIVRAVGLSAAVSIIFGGTTGSLGELGLLLVQLKYTRSAEREADEIALSILQKAEIPSKPFATFFSKLEEKRNKILKSEEEGGKEQSAARQKNGFGKTLELLRTHPPTPDRIAVIESQPDWKTRPLLSDDEWQALRKICD